MYSNAITYGTFDLFHYGHLQLLKRIKMHAKYLYVGCSSDKFNHEKSKKSAFSYNERRDILIANRYVDCVFSENSWDQKISDIKKYNIDLFVMGDDWLNEFDYLDKYCDVIYLPRTPDISSTLVKSKIKAENFSLPI
jgi:glycerol-3-phosphate cytidylyltransferase